jgi:hypothetical protein
MFVKYITKLMVLGFLWLSINNNIYAQRSITADSSKLNNDAKSRAALDAKIDSAQKQKNMPQYALLNVQRIERDGLDTAGINKVFFNNFMFSVMFQHLTDKSALKKCASWMRAIIDNEEPTMEHIDTYANLLYKAGDVADALNWEEKAVSLAPDNIDLKKTFELMKEKKPTWIP